MSSDTDSVVEQAPPQECTYCTDPLTEEMLAFQTYPASGADSLGGLVADGLLLCPACASEPVALLDSWDDHPAPPVTVGGRIGDGYSEAADSCSFCADPLESGPVLGVECYRRPGETLPAYANYTLCVDCRGVFEEFLRNLRDEVA